MNVAIIGYGKMGREVEKMLAARGHNVAMVIDAANVGELNPEKLRENAIEVALEFSTPETAFGNIRICLDSAVAVVSGTTGWLARKTEIERLCGEKGGAFFYASNFSIGVNVFFKVNEFLARMMNSFPAYDVTLEEIHHTQKKDAPSGTAITLAEGILAAIGRKEAWTGSTTTEPHELEVLSVRRGDVIGTHEVTYESPADRLTIRHEAKNRQGLALGAVLAAEYIRGRKGIFSMDDLLGINRV